MSLSCRSERSLLNHEEYSLVRKSHYPDILDAELDEIQKTRDQIKQMRDKERTLAFHKRREVRNKAEARGGSFPGTAGRPLQRKQVFAGALKRLNKEISRLKAWGARESLTQSAQRALALRRANVRTHHPAASNTANQGMQKIVNKRRRGGILGSQIGSVSQATKNAQAQRDSRS